VNVLLILITVGISLPASFFVGAWWGKRRTVKLFHSLQDSGDLVVMTKDQHKGKTKQGSIQALMRAGEDEDEDEEGIDEIQHRRRDSPERRVDWAASMIKGRQQRGDDE
jgi:hypothetical protein